MRRVWNFSLAGAVAVVGIVVGTASPAEAQGVIRACVQKSSLQVRIIPEGENCRSTEFLVQWNSQGQQGPQGIQGPQGLQGPKGDQGDPGQSVSLQTLGQGDANCPNGGVAITSAGGSAYVCNGADASGSMHPPLVGAAEIAQINTWAGFAPGEAPQWTLCYKGTRDARNTLFMQEGGGGFHARCDNKGKTFFVAKSLGGRLFGGYTSLAWGAAQCNYRSDPSAFLFSLTNNFRHSQEDSYLFMLGYQYYYSIYDCSSYGPTFGGGHDFYTDLRQYTYTYLGHSYGCRVGTYGSQECIEDLAGSYTPVLVELEVYSEL